MAPAEELERLQYYEQKFDVGMLDGEKTLPVKNGESFRLRATIDPRGAKTIGLRVRVNAEETEYAEILVDIASGKLILDTTHSGSLGLPNREEAPFVLMEGEMLTMDIFVDHSIIEVYVCERQALCRRGYPTDPENSMGITAISDGADFIEVMAWEIMPTNLY